MEQKKDLIYTGEQVEVFPPHIDELDTVCPETRRESAPPPRKSGWFSGLTVGVALFAAAFLLCESAHALKLNAQSTAGEGESAGWLSHLLSGSFATTAPTVPDSTSPAIDGTGAATVTPDTNSTSATTPSTDGDTPVPDSTTAPDPPKTALTEEQLYAFSADAVPQGMIPIVPMDLSLSSYGETFHYNDTSYTLSLKDLPTSTAAIPASAAVGEVSVLILHTHATEGYSPDGATYYDPSTTLARADDPSQGVVAVGQVIADILNQNGIVTLHSTVLHDLESYKDSYSRSAQTIASYLEQYPSIRLVIDVHRDSIMTSAEQLVRPVTLVDGEATAQVMCVVGSNASGAAYDDWQDNLSLAVRLRNALNADYGNLCRPVYIKKSTYNQQYAPASLLLEIGSSGNTLEEAKNAAELVAGKIVEMLK